jgi:histidine decarboxylase
LTHPDTTNDLLEDERREPVPLELEAMMRQFDEDRQLQIGFPGATDFDYSGLAPFFGYLLNNVGDPDVGSLFRSHTKDLEQEVVTFFADLFGAPDEDRWGYVTSGGTESNLYALYVARSLYPDALVYCSEASRYSNLKAVDLLAMPLVTVPADGCGEIDYGALGGGAVLPRARPERRP